MHSDFELVKKCANEKNYLNESDWNDETCKNCVKLQSFMKMLIAKYCLLNTLRKMDKQQH